MDSKPIKLPVGGGLSPEQWRQVANTFPSLWTLRDVCDHYDISTTTVTNWAKEGIFKPIYFGRVPMFHPEEVHAASEEVLSRKMPKSRNHGC